MKVIFEKISKRYGDTYAVKELSLQIADGELHFFLGPSGCGKTTALRILAGLESPSHGRILFGTQDVTNFRAVDRNVGMVFQNYALWPHMTVYKNVEYGLKIKKKDRSEIAARVREVLALTQLEQFAQRLPGQLSGGQQQRVALARALATTPNVLLLDEPLSNLDAKLRLEMRANLLEIHQKTKITTVYVTHDQKEALSMGSSITVMRAGEVMQSGTPRQLYDHPRNAFLAGFIGETNLMRGRVIKKGKGGALQLFTAIGELDSCREDNSAFAVDETVLLSLRPEAIRVQKSEAKHNRISLTVARLTYLGESEQLTLTPPNAATPTLKASIYSVTNLDLEEGDTCDFHIDARDVQVLKDSDSLDSET